MSLADRPSPRRRSVFVRVLLRESFGPLLIAALALVVLERMVDSAWLRYLLYDGDSLALPLLLQSLERGEPLRWVMTSQLFLFPEFPLYLVSAVLGQTVQASLIVNGVLNVLVMYALVRWITARLMVGRVRVLQVLVAFASTAVFLATCLTETGRDLGERDITGAIASTYLLTTYYYGVVVSGLLCLALAMELTAGFRTGIPMRRGRVIGLLALLAGVSAVTTLSNPLFLLDVVAPLIAVLVLMWMLNRLPVTRLLLLGGSIGLGALLGYATRIPLAGYIGAEASSYLHIERAGESARWLLQFARELRVAPGGTLEIIILGLLLLLAVTGTIFGVFTQVRPSWTLQVGDAAFLLYAFVVVEAAAVLVGQIVTGSLVARYLMPVPAFSVLAVVALADSRALQLTVRAARDRLRVLGVSRVLRPAGVVGALGLAVAALVVGVPPVAAAAQERADSPDQDCLLAWLDGRELSGVASFWSARSLSVYGPPSIDVQQVNFDFTPQLWVTNLSDYTGKTFSYVLADHVPDWGVVARAGLGEPASVTACTSFDIYDYAGAPGAEVLNTIVDESIAREEENRGF